MEKNIMIAVARADLMIVTALKVLLAIGLLSVVTLMLVLTVRGLMIDPDWIDYDAPGVDITSEGPEDGDPWYDEW